MGKAMKSKPLQKGPKAKAKAKFLQKEQSWWQKGNENTYISKFEEA